MLQQTTRTPPAEGEERGIDDTASITHPFQTTHWSD